jgi:hypothetical protein
LVFTNLWILLTIAKFSKFPKVDKSGDVWAGAAGAIARKIPIAERAMVVAVRSFMARYLSCWCMAIAYFLRWGRWLAKDDSFSIGLFRFISL